MFNNSTSYSQESRVSNVAFHHRTSSLRAAPHFFDQIMNPSASAKTKVVQFGLGPIGFESLRLAATKPWINVVGGLDIDPAKIGKSLDEVLNDNRFGGARVYSNFNELAEKPDVVLHTACSKFADFCKQVDPIVRAGISVVSSCEELIFPQLKNAALAEEFDTICRKSGARVVGTGVNPGFVMDVLPVCLTGVSRSVTSIEVDRVVNASTRRLPLQKKIGSGIDPDEFRRMFAEGRAGHAGLRESLALVAHAMQWKVGEISEHLEPMIAPHDIKTQYLEVARGLTCGIHQHSEASTADGKRIVLDLKMYLEAADPHDAIRVEGDPSLNMRLAGGVAGDAATVAAVINAIPRLLNAAPGLRLMTELAVPCVA
jgi:4-hydroxy-tetrahydrodipicolinate reductase